MDTAGVCMWCAALLIHCQCSVANSPPHCRTDLILAKHARKRLLIWDNCGPHCTRAVRRLLLELGITVAWLPPNMTDLVQVSSLQFRLSMLRYGCTCLTYWLRLCRSQIMDLIVNAIVKAGFRSLRAQDLFDYMQSFQCSFAVAMALRGSKPETPLPSFDPPKTKVSDGLLKLHEVMSTACNNEKFRAGMKR